MVFGRYQKFNMTYLTNQTICVNMEQKNTGQNGGKPRLDLNVLSAWAQGFTGKNVTTAIMDDGVDYMHPDLRENYVSWQFSCHPGPLMVKQLVNVRLLSDCSLSLFLSMSFWLTEINFFLRMPEPVMISAATIHSRIQGIRMTGSILMVQDVREKFLPSVTTVSVVLE